MILNLFSFSLTLIDSLDTLVILGDLDEFERGVKLVIENVNFDHDIVVSVFETNIRVVGWDFAFFRIQKEYRSKTVFLVQNPVCKYNSFSKKVRK